MRSTDQVHPDHTEAHEIQELRRCVRDLIALSTLPAFWSCQKPSSIAESLADALLSMLRLDLVYVQLQAVGKQDPEIAVRADGRPEIADRAQAIRSTLAPYLRIEITNQLQIIPNPVGDGDLRLISLPIGYDAGGGIVVVASRRSQFPTERDQLLYRIATNQAAIALAQQKLVEDALQKRHQTAVLEERNRLAGEIHDTLAQGLTGIVIQLQLADRVVGIDPQGWRASVEQALLLAQGCLEEARRSVKALRPSALEGSDLASALKRMLEQMTHLVSIGSEYQMRGMAYALSPEVENSLLRVGQEALTNALRHAHASEIKMTLTYEPGQVRLCVEDNGRGFDTAQPDADGFGLTGMQERATRIRASLTLFSRPGYGTTVEMIVPVTAGVSTLLEQSMDAEPEERQRASGGSES
jgi:signal transduction histidine kinase